MYYEWPNNLNFTVADNAPYDSVGFPYTTGSKSLTNSTEDRDGQWAAHEVWADIHDGSLTAIITYTVPLSFDANGHITSTVGFDMDMTWTTIYINSLDIPVSDVSIIFPDTLEVLASSYSVLAPGFRKKNASDDTSYALWIADDTPEPRLSTAIATLKAHLGDTPLTPTSSTRLGPFVKEGSTCSSLS